MKQLWSLTIDQYLEVVELAQKNGVKPGESMQKEFEIVAKKYNLIPLGQTNMDKDLLAGNLREEGINVIDFDELKRQREGENNV